jgi:hypothetical protein
VKGPLAIEALEFQAGLGPGDPPLRVETPEAVILVGPNNSGKSVALREIERWCIGDNAARKVVRDVDIQFPPDREATEILLTRFETDPPENQGNNPGHIWVGQHTFRPNEPVIKYQVATDGAIAAALNHDVDAVRSLLLRLYVVRLDGRTRFLLSDPKPTGDLLSTPQNHLWALFQDEESRRRVRQLTDEAFGLHFTVDPTAMSVFRIRMSSRPPEDAAEEQSLDPRARAFQDAAPLVGDLSDGVQAFTGLVSAVLSLPHRVILIDEPEAFLHPPLARRLGASLAELASERGATLVVATHSADLVMGCVEARPATTIVRLTYRDEVATARALAAGELADLMHDPLLRSTGALKGLFHPAVLVTESDSDRAFYDEMNRRLLEQGRGLDDALFVNAQNWQTIPRLLAPLRRLGIPAAAIIDFDTLAGDNHAWRSYYDALGLGEEERMSLEGRRAACTAYLAHAGAKIYKEQGVGAFDGRALDAIQALIGELAGYGLFVVPLGELEQWLIQMGVVGKTRWVARIFDVIGSDPEDENYLHPSDEDVWAFLDGISAWAANPRLGGSEL